jgi:spore coat polysaccharide biosynthesis protein SpsF
MMKVAAIVQARVGSSRLAGKVLFDLGGKTVLHHVLNRCQAIAQADVVVCAVPDEPASNPLIEVAEECGAGIFCGSEADVLARYLGAARAHGADIVLRVTSDCPLIDPQVCGELIDLRARTQVDYAANNMPPSYPHGLDCEAFTVAALSEAAERATAADDREHVTPWLRRAAHIRRVNLSSGNPKITGHRWTLDYEEDLAFFRALFGAMQDAEGARMQDILAFLNAHPEIAKINASRRRA